jgi:hypothetical protein
MHRTDAGEKRRTLQREARGLERGARILQKVKEMSPAARLRQDEAARLRAEAESPKAQARLEDLHIWQMKKVKTTKRGSKKYAYWMASWRERGNVHNVHLGSCRKISEEEALQKARAMKAEALGLNR